MKLSINTKPSYDVIVGYSILQSFDDYLDIFNRDQLFILCFSSNLAEKTKELHFDLKQKKYNIKLLEVNDGEKEKGIDNVKYILQK